MSRTQRKLARCGGAALSLSLAACTSMQPAYQRPAQPVPNKYPTGAAYTGSTARTTATPAASLGWQDFFGDERLRRLIQIALDNNRDLRIATLSIEQARAQYRIQRAAQFPAIGANVGLLSQHVPADVRAPGVEAVQNQFTAGVGFSAFELDVFGRVRSLRDAALQQYLAIAEVRRSAQISLVAEVASAYLTLQADQALLRLSQETLNTQQSAVDMIARSQRAGGMADIDMHRARTQLETARVGVEQYSRQVAQDQNALGVLLGRPLPQDLMPPPEFDDASVAELPAGLPSTLLEQRPDIVAAEHRLRAANANIGAARAAFFPTITLTAAVGVASSTLAGLFSGGMGAWALAPQLSVPIFTGGANQANLDAAQALRDINVALYERTVQQAFREVADGLAARGTYDRQAAAQQALIDEIVENRRLSDMRFHNGVDDYFPVFDAQRQLYTAQQTLVTIQLARLTSRVALYKALGGGWTRVTVAGNAPPPAPAR
ncbi:efflux transporter outer membrane subunit [Pigmentiphaga soli]|uniref:Efflux transporter outer membrane subunit n=1 Tax=Pigmentiphaga soli TaxID=1007095 RepID=A0ABP8GY40_9BURK